MHRYAYTLTRNNEQARDTVQQVFTNLWEKRNSIELTTSLQSYLYKAVYNHCLNYRTRTVFFAPVEAHHHQSAEPTGNGAGKIEIKELEQQIQLAVNKLPEQCRAVFVLSRYEQKSYAEIAQLLQISQKTVEGHISRALRTMREELKAYMPVTAGSVFILLYLTNYYG